MAVRLTLRHRWPRNLGELLQDWVNLEDCSLSDKCQPVGEAIFCLAR